MKGDDSYSGHDQDDSEYCCIKADSPHDLGGGLTIKLSGAPRRRWSINDEIAHRSVAIRELTATPGPTQKALALPTLRKQLQSGCLM